MNEISKIRNSVIEKGLPCEFIGNWLWVTEFNSKDVYFLKSLHFHYSKNKNAWYYTDKPFQKKTNKIFDLEDLRKIYNKDGIVVV